MDADGENQTRKTYTAVNKEWAYLSNDTTKIVYSIGDFPNYDIWIMDTNGGNQQELWALPNIQAFPKWSRDDQKIAFNNAIFQNNTFSGDIYVVDHDGTDTMQITHSPTSVVSEDPYWSPAGDKMVFQSNQSGNYQIYIMDSNGGNESRLTNHPGNDYWSSWGPGSVSSAHDNYQGLGLNLFQLFQNYPNPFNPTTTIEYLIPKLSFVSLKVCVLLGNEIQTLVNEEKQAGEYNVDFNATALPSGVYFYILRAGSLVETKKMVFLN